MDEEQGEFDIVGHLNALTGRINDLTMHVNALSGMDAQTQAAIEELRSMMQDLPPIPPGMTWEEYSAQYRHTVQWKAWDRVLRNSQKMWLHNAIHTPVSQVVYGKAKVLKDQIFRKRVVIGSDGKTSVK